MKLFADGFVRYLRIPFRRIRKPDGPTPAFLIGFSKWKTFMPNWLPDRDIRMLPMKVTEGQWILKWRPWMLWDRRSEIYVWSYKDMPFMRAFMKRRGMKITRIEDGFLRSVHLGAEHFEPVSMVFDQSGALYFDATHPSDLEKLIEETTNGENELLIARARAGITRLLTTRLSKYNTSTDFDAESLYGPKRRQRILVVGQVEGDMSMKLGMERQMTNNDLVWYAARENPDAEIIYKPHPEVLRDIRKDPPQSDPAEVAGVARILFEDVTLADAFDTIDHVYTMTSLSGFEALLRGIKVTCLGMPFYAGWGLTDDRQSCPRRTARPSIEEVFAAAYILYPRYFDPILKEPITFEQALDLLAFMRDRLKENRARPHAAETKSAPPLAALG